MINDMKRLIISVCCILLTGLAEAQNTKMFSLSPMKKNTSKVSGVVLGIGHLQENQEIQTINGVNIDLFALSPLIAIHNLAQYSPPKAEDAIKEKRDRQVRLISNGLNIALGGYFDRVVHNGISIAMYNMGTETNGITLNVAFNAMNRLNGLHISGIGNFSYESRSVNIAIMNNNIDMTGLQIGITNTSYKYRGVQIGIFNRTNSLRGLQVGLWNKNNKRSLPFINF